MSDLYPNENYIGPPNEAFSVVIRLAKGRPCAGLPDCPPASRKHRGRLDREDRKEFTLR